MVYRIKAIQVFLLSLLFALVLHGMYWKTLDDSPDQQNWIREMTRFQETSLASQRSSLYYGYPAVTLLGPSYILGKMGIPPERAFVGIMAFGIALPVAFATSLCFLLRPKSLWAIGVAGVLTTSQSYYNSTPPSAIVTALSTCLILYALYIYEKKKNDAYTALFFGGISGVAMATRLDIPLVVLSFLCVFLVPTLKKQIITVAFAALIVFILCNPYMLAFPLLHLGDIVRKITYHTALSSSSAFPVRRIALTIPLSIMGFVASMAGLLFPRVFRNSIPRAFLAIVLSMCIAISTLLIVFSAYHPVWYFYPILQIFEVCFVLYLLDALAVTKRIVATWPVLTLLVFGNASIFFMRLFL